MEDWQDLLYDKIKDDDEYNTFEEGLKRFNSIKKRVEKQII